MTRIGLTAGILLMAGCSQMEMPPMQTADRVKLEPIQVEIDGKPYEVRRNQDTFPSGRVEIRWAVVKDGQIVSCREPTVESCKRALDGLERETQGGMY